MVAQAELPPTSGDPGTNSVDLSDDHVEDHVEATDGHPETDAPHEFQPE